MLDLPLTREQKELRESVLPAAHENDINHHVDKSITDRMAQMDLLGASTPEGYGGLDFVPLTIITEEIERGDTASMRPASRKGSNETYVLNRHKRWICYSITTGHLLVFTNTERSR